MRAIGPAAKVWVIVMAFGWLTGCGSVNAKPDPDAQVTSDVPPMGGCTANALSCGADDALYQCDANGAAESKVQDCQYGCTNDHCNECDANTTFCSGDDLVECDASGTIVNPQTCEFGCQMNRCNACDPGSKYCDGASAVTCGADGEPESMMSCGANGCLGGVCNACTPNTTTCDGDTLVVCNAQGTVASATPCSLGCGTSPNAHCKALVPSYGVAAPSGSLPNLVIDADATLDIGGCGTLNVLLTKGGQTTAVPNTQLANVAQAGGPAICVVRYGAITVANGFTLTVKNNAASGHVLSLQAVGDVHIDGTISFTNSAVGPAPGASVSVVGGDTNKSPGPGGAGAARAGGRGGTCLDCSGTTDFPGGAGGSAVTTISTRLLPGSAGGNATTSSGPAGVGGAGGGGLQLVSLSRVVFAATGRIALNGNGGFGGSGAFQICPNRSTGGGGSGGTLVVEAPTVSLSAGTVLAANGGGGGGGCTENVMAGDFYLCVTEGGQPGQLSATRAAGGDCKYSGTVGDGGWEANGTTNPSINGFDSDVGAANVAAGGGGGSSGFIILRARSQADVMFPGTSIVSPMPTLGAVTAN